MGDEVKVLYFSNIPSPYRVDYFNELGKLCDLTVVFEAEAASQLNSSWFSQTAKNFMSYFVKKGPINEKKIDFNIMKYIEKNLYDVVIVTNYSLPTEMLMILTLKLKRIPFFIEVDGGLIKKEHILKKFVKKFFISSAKYWLSTGEVTDKYLIHYGAKRERIFHYPFTSLNNNDILTSVKTNSEKQFLKKELNVESKRVAISVGQLIHRKGFDVLIKAWEKVDNDIKLIIIGSGEKEKEFKELIRSRNLNNIEILDFMDKLSLFKYYQACDLFILPTREDIWGLVINEAMANALPIITTDKCVAGLELVKENENGNIVDVEDENILAEKINLILKDEILLMSMSEKSLQKINMYTIENMAKEHINIFYKMVGKR